MANEGLVRDPYRKYHHPGGSWNPGWGMDPSSSKVDLATAHMTGSLLKRGPVYGYAFQARCWERKNKLEKTFVIF